MCKNCNDIDTIFGTWSIVYPAKDCRDLQVSIETKRDIFRRDMFEFKKQQKFEEYQSKLIL